MRKKVALTALLFALASALACPSARCQPADSSQVWYGPSMGSDDLLQLFTNPTQWDSARSQIDVFQFLTHHVNSWPCVGGLCNSNTLTNLAAVQAFTKLEQWGIEIAIEGAGILPQTPFGTSVDCSAERQNAAQNAFNWTVDAIVNVQNNGGTVRYIAIDEPIRRWYSPIYPPLGGPECKTESLAEIAAMVAEFITMMNNAAPSIIVGQIILYPEVDVDGIKTYVTELENLGINLPFIHLDVHGLRIIDYAGTTYGSVTLAQLKTDLQELETFLGAHSIAFAPILIDLRFNTQLYEFGQYTDSVYYEGAIDWINQVDSAIGQPDHLIFESWAMPQYSDTNLTSVITPINLPENDTLVFSHTRLVNEGMAIFNPPTPSCCNTAGDANNDGTSNIADVTYLIARIFAGGSAPPCADEGDANGDNSVNIADVTFLIARIFAGGAAPVCGTTGN